MTIGAGARYHFLLPPDLELADIVDEINALGQNSRITAMDTTSPAIDLAHRIYLWQRMADMGILSPRLSVISPPHGYLRNEWGFARYLTDTAFPRSRIVQAIVSAGREIQERQLFPWLNSLGYTGCLLDTSGPLIQQTDIVVEPVQSHLPKADEWQALSDFIRDKIDEPRWEIAIQISHRSLLKEQGSAAFLLFDRSVSQTDFSPSFVGPPANSFKRVPRSFAMPTQQRSPKDVIPIQMLPLLLVNDRPSFMHVFSSDSDNTAPSEDFIYLIVNPPPEDHVRKELPIYGNIRNLSRYNGRRRFALAATNLRDLRENMKDPPVTIIEVERQVSISGDHITYEMGLAAAGSDPVNMPIERAMRYVRYLAAVAFTDIALIKARSEEHDRFPSLHLEIGSQDAATDPIALGLRLASRGFRRRFHHLGHKSSINLSLPAVTTPNTSSERSISDWLAATTRS